jgi:hypothetical protein
MKDMTRVLMSLGMDNDPLIFPQNIKILRIFKDIPGDSL